MVRPQRLELERQAYRYPIDSWSESEARSHCRAHESISFEPTKSSGVDLRLWALAVYAAEGASPPPSRPTARTT